MLKINDQLREQVVQLEKIQICGNKANAQISYGWRPKQTNAQLRYWNSHWYCKDHLNKNLKKSFRNGKVTVEYPQTNKFEEESLKKHIEKRAEDDYYGGKYRVQYKRQWY